MATNTTGKKEFRKTITAKLESTFADLQNGLKEKKFKAAMKRAGKLLANDLYSKNKKEKKKKDQAPVEEMETAMA